MPEENVCEKCNQEMLLLRERIISGTKYKILKCGKCRHQVARLQS